MDMTKTIQVGIKELIIGAGSLVLAATLGWGADSAIHWTMAINQIPAIETRLSALEDANRQQAISLTGFGVQLGALEERIKEYHEEEMVILNHEVGQNDVIKAQIKEHDKATRDLGNKHPNTINKSGMNKNGE